MCVLKLAWDSGICHPVTSHLSVASDWLEIASIVVETMTELACH